MNSTSEEVLLTQIKEFRALSEYMDDSEFDEALDIVVSLIRKPEIMPQRAAHAVVKLQAICFKFAMAKTYYMSIQKDKEKKNIYFAADEAIKRLVDALKYIARV